MKIHCSLWTAVAEVHVHCVEDTALPGYYAVKALHRHKGSLELKDEEYGGLTWQEAQDVVEAVLEATRPGFRHSHLQSLQDRLFD